MIPKVIHYCWFGKNDLPEEAQKCIASWKKFCPDYEIKEWNEKNYDVRKNKYMSDAYNEKKWAFVSDYARIDIIYNYGGIYLDTDVELLRPLDELLKDKMFCGWESRDPILDEKKITYENSVAFGLGFGAEKNNNALKDMLKLYEKLNFINEDGSLNLMACPHYQTEILKKYGLDDSKRTYQRIMDDIIVYPENYFSPKSMTTGKITLTDETYSIHHFSGTWIEKENPVKKRIKQVIEKSEHRSGKNIVVEILKFPYKKYKDIRQKIENWRRKRKVN